MLPKVIHPFLIISQLLPVMGYEANLANSLFLCKLSSENWRSSSSSAYYWPAATEDDCFLLPSPLFLLTTECAEYT